MDQYHAYNDPNNEKLKGKFNGVAFISFQNEDMVNLMLDFFEPGCCSGSSSKKFENNELEVRRAPEPGIN